MSHAMQITSLDDDVLEKENKISVRLESAAVPCSTHCIVNDNTILDDFLVCISALTGEVAI